MTIYSSCARAQIAFNATMMVAGMTKVMSALRTPARYGPTVATSASVLPPSAETMTNDTVARRNGVVSFPVTLRNPTINPNNIRTDVVTAPPLPAEKIPTSSAMMTPIIKAQPPTFTNRFVDCFAIVYTPTTFVVL